VAYPGDVDPDADVLARDVPDPVTPGADQQRRRVSRFRADLDDPSAQVSAGAQRIDKVEIVSRNQRRGDQPRKLDRPITQTRSGVASVE
jgi:hypothetical protein